MRVDRTVMVTERALLMTSIVVTVLPEANVGWIAIGNRANPKTTKKDLNI